MVRTCHARSTEKQTFDGFARGISARIDHNLERLLPSKTVALSQALRPVCRRKETPRPCRGDVDGIPCAQSHTTLRCWSDMLFRVFVTVSL